MTFNWDDPEMAQAKAISDNIRAIKGDTYLALVSQLAEMISFSGLLGALHEVHNMPGARLGSKAVEMLTLSVKRVAETMNYDTKELVRDAGLLSKFCTSGALKAWREENK